MGEFLVVPVVVVVMLAVVWALYFGRSVRREREHLDTLPDEPYARRQQEIADLRAEHAQTDPAKTTHPARRP
jgi:hypothetical protein